MRWTDGSRGSPFVVRLVEDAGSDRPSIANRRGERRHIPRYHPPWSPIATWRPLHLSAVSSMGATHPILLAARIASFLRSAAPGRVPHRFRSGLPPSPDRSCGDAYFSPSLRAARASRTEKRLGSVIVYLRRRLGRREGERESSSSSIPWWRCIMRAPPSRASPSDRQWRCHRYRPLLLLPAHARRLD